MFVNQLWHPSNHSPLWALSERSPCCSTLPGWRKETSYFDRRVGSGNSSEDKSKAPALAQRCSHRCLATCREPAAAPRAPGMLGQGLRWTRTAGRDSLAQDGFFWVASGSATRTCKEQEGFLVIKHFFIWIIQLFLQQTWTSMIKCPPWRSHTVEQTPFYCLEMSIG